MLHETAARAKHGFARATSTTACLLAELGGQVLSSLTREARAPSELQPLFHRPFSPSDLSARAGTTDVTLGGERW
jgi:hypothetical protein